MRILIDEDFNNAVLRGLARQKHEVDIVRVQDVGLSGVDDPDVLMWAAQQGRILLTHDVSTITKYAYDRIAAGEEMPGVFEVSRTTPIGPVIEDILLLLECSTEREWVGQIIYLPLR